jgi:NadR type nicotinamide-nucleotide adenylyltransferase
MPRNDEADEVQQEWLSWLLQTVLLCEPDAMFGSEHYLVPTCDRLSRNFGQRVVPHLVDLHREQFAISASRIRGNIHAHRQWLHPDVYRDFVCRVVLLGAESSGKTTLAQALAAEFDTVWVPEYGRQLWEEKDGQLTLGDLEDIGRVQVANEEALLGKANGVLFCDTSPLTTLGYAGWMYDASPESLQLLSQRSYDLTILCSTDFGFIQDGTRQSGDFQRVQQQWYDAQMAGKASPCVIARGNLVQRVQQLKPVIDGLLRSSPLTCSSPAVPA